jgi:hypothetical protein
MDAQVSYEFHSERKRNPEKFRHQLRNQVYFVFRFVSNTALFFTYLAVSLGFANPISMVSIMHFFDAGYIC